MKKICTAIFITIIISNVNAQSWNTSGNSGITTSNFLGTTDANALIIKANATQYGKLASNGVWTFGKGANYVKITSTGKLSFNGTGSYWVGDNAYVFQNSTNTNYGLFFNAAIPQFEFRGSNAQPVFYVDANAGNGVFTGNLKIGAYTLPSTDGSAGQVLQTNGAGNVSWASISGGGSQWTTNGSNIYYNSGNVGIGTNAPTAPLHINMASAGTAVRLQSPSPEVSFYDNTGAYKGYVWYDGANNMVLGTSCGNTNGNVKLRMNCNDVFTISPLGNISLSGSSAAMGITTAGTFSGGFFGSGADFYLNASRQNSIEGTTTGNLILQTTTGTGITLHTAGNLGIGTTTPTVKVEVQTADAKWGIIHTNGTVRVGTYVGSTGGWLATQSNSPLYFCTGLLNQNGSAQMTLLLNGNFGIGTLSPAYKLDVCGTIRSKEVLVQTGWCDYVFDENYKLRSLDEVSKYIQQNKHLPDLPSANEIENNGVKVAQMDSVMIKKIEELTLYVIQQNDKLTQQDQQIQKLEAKLEALENENGETKKHN